MNQEGRLCRSLLSNFLISATDCILHKGPEPSPWHRCPISVTYLPKEGDMKKIIVLLAMIVLLIGCENHPQSKILNVTATALVPRASPTEGKSAWAIFDPDPNHPWNRTFRQFYRRTTSDGTEY